eukprot:2963116-Alexandrium_andersonii.AAC.1
MGLVPNAGRDGDGLQHRSSLGRSDKIELAHEAAQGHRPHPIVGKGLGAERSSVSEEPSSPQAELLPKMGLWAIGVCVRT